MLLYPASFVAISASLHRHSPATLTIGAFREAEFFLTPVLGCIRIDFLKQIEILISKHVLIYSSTSRRQYHSGVIVI